MNQATPTRILGHRTRPDLTPPPSPTPCMVLGIALRQLGRSGHLEDRSLVEALISLATFLEKKLNVRAASDLRHDHFESFLNRVDRRPGHAEREATALFWGTVRGFPSGPTRQIGRGGDAS